MATPLTATWRIRLPYIVSGLTHVWHGYVGVSNPNNDSTKLDTRDTPDFLLWTDAADAINDAFGNLLPSTASFGTAVLEQRTGSIWTPYATHTISTSFGGTLSPASQVTLTLRDTVGKKTKVVVLDTFEVPPQKIINLTGGDANMDGFLSQFAPTADEPAMVTWLKSRGDNFMAFSAVVSTSVTLNDRVVRDRGL